MATGDVTATQLGVYNISGAALLTALSAMNVGAATNATETATIHLVPHGNGQVSIIKLARAA